MKEFKVENFTYNGFMVEGKPGVAKYTAKFNSWTNDPGIILADCSDGKQRYIPTCCLIDAKREDLPEQPKNELVYFGKPSNS